MKKKLNIDAMQNELRGGSAFFPSYTENQQDRPAPVKREEVGNSRNGHTTSPVPPVLPVPPVRGKENQPVRKRVMKSRHPFDVYEDQYQSLRELAMKERMQGGAGSMSAMVREALDTYIEKHSKE
jgi:hypothetical protein